MTCYSFNVLLDFFLWIIFFSTEFINFTLLWCINILSLLLISKCNVQIISTLSPNMSPNVILGIQDPPLCILLWFGRTGCLNNFISKLKVYISLIYYQYYFSVSTIYQCLFTPPMWYWRLTSRRLPWDKFVRHWGFTGKRKRVKNKWDCCNGYAYVAPW